MIRLWFGEYGHAYGGFDVSLAPTAAVGLNASSRVPIAAVMAIWYERTRDPPPSPRCQPASARHVRLEVHPEHRMPYRWLNPPDSCLVMDTVTGCLPKWATASRKSSMSRAAMSWLTPRRTRMRCTATSETAPVRV